MKQGISVGIAALLVGSAGGFLVGKAASSSGGETADASGSSVSLVRESKRSGSGDERLSRADSVEGALREPSQLARLQSLMDLYAGMDAAQLEEAAKNLDSLPMGDRIMASMLLFSQWGEIDPQGALAFTKTMGFGGMFAKPTVLRSWASVDPVNAAKYFSENPNDFADMGGRGGPGGDNGAGVIAREWAKLDPQAALDWAQGLDGRDKSSALVSVLGEMAAKDPAEAASVASGLEGDDRNRAYSEIAEKWAQSDYASAEAWISTLTGEDKQDALASAIGVLAKSDPVGASAKISSMAEGGEKERAIRDVGSSWAREDPAAAAAWVASQESGSDGMRNVMATWAGQDATAALSFIESQPQGEIRDSATQAYLWTDRSMAPSQSITLAETITDDRDRSRAVGMTASRWMREDEAAAKAYVQQSTAISDEVKERILSGDAGRGGGDRGRGGRGR
ncbi:hypothetical protein ACFQY0_16585 [Haloferula chungangensis]|uniref:HEAT repeat domain-containing protein n=1 Tax=Haloferula chungangensis TaxID=1048331 RepID=A0ABW2LB41_9BACT